MNSIYNALKLSPVVGDLQISSEIIFGAPDNFDKETTLFETLKKCVDSIYNLELTNAYLMSSCVKGLVTIVSVTAVSFFAAEYLPTYIAIIGISLFARVVTEEVSNIIYMQKLQAEEQQQIHFQTQLAQKAGLVEQTLSHFNQSLKQFDQVSLQFKQDLILPELQECVVELQQDLDQFYQASLQVRQDSILPQLQKYTEQFQHALNQFDIASNQVVQGAGLVLIRKAQSELDALYDEFQTQTYLIGNSEFIAKHNAVNKELDYASLHVKKMQLSSIETIAAANDLLKKLKVYLTLMK